jgi:hypothetical protein
MPNRILRASVWNSDRFLQLPDNTHRICYLRCLSDADDVGNLEASDGALVRLWRDLGADSRQKALTILEHLVDAHLLRTYEVVRKRYAHIPRFGQRLRNIMKKHPPSPWDGISDLDPETTADGGRTAATRGRTPLEVNRIESNRSETKGREGEGKGNPEAPGKQTRNAVDLARELAEKQNRLK